MTPEVDHVRIPDEVRFVGNKLCEQFPKRATFTDGGITIRDFSPEEKLVTEFTTVAGHVDDIIDNINSVMSDLGLLAQSSRAFADNHPFRRYKLLVRLFFYEFGRFEDAFGYYTLWMQRHGMLTKQARRSQMNNFHEQLKPLFVARNICLHDAPTWKPDTSPEIAILQGLEMFGLTVSDKAGRPLEWDPHLRPLCEKRVSTFFEFTAGMRTTWNMLFATAAEYFIAQGKLAPTQKPFKPRQLVRRKTRGKVLGSG
jgi:hypothetical protein